jgi:uncharacterized protein YggE
MENCECKGKFGCCQKSKIVILLVGMVLLTIIVLSAILRDRIVSQQFRQVTAIGQGKVSYSPDIASINLGVQLDKVPNATKGLEDLNKKIAEIIKVVTEQGVAVEDIQTQNYVLYPLIETNYQNISTTTGYNISQQLIVRVKDYDTNPDRLNLIISLASKAGANQISNLFFDSTKMNQLKQEARIQAIKDAKEKGLVLAQTAGEKINNIGSWYENVIQPQPMYAGGMGGYGGGGGMTQITPSNREVIVEMNVTFNLK